eukprot:gene17606-19359_t
MMWWGMRRQKGRINSDVLVTYVGDLQCQKAIINRVIQAFIEERSLQVSTDSCKGRRPCPAIPVRPVCGTNLKTYNNMCMLRHDKCNGKDVEPAYRGVCKSCEEDIPGVIKMVLKSFFNEKRKRNGPKGRERGSPCVKTDHRVIEQSAQMNCLQWKFTISDTNGDGVLSGRELHPTLRAIRRHYGDKRCLRRLIRHCDKNKDRKVTLNEWLTCMHSTELTKCQTMKERALKRSSNVPTYSDTYVPSCTSKGTFSQIQCHNSTGYCWCSTSDGRPIPGSSVKFKKPNCSEVANASCFKTLIAAITRFGRAKKGSYFVPRCFDDGTFKPIQCHIQAGYCWCVNKQGQKTPGTSKLMTQGRPDCSGGTRRRTYKGCTEKQRKDFDETFLQEIEKEMKASGRKVTAGTQFLESMTSISRTTRVLNWKFKQLDLDKDSKISKGELRIVKMRWQRISVDCAAAVSYECDKNGDDFITWTEWKDCIGTKTAVSSNPRPATRPYLPVVCKPMRICLLPCTRGFERDKHGCLICKCRGM